VKIRILAFASAAEALGKGETELEVPDGARLGDLREQLLTRCPALEPIWPRLAIALDGELAGEDAALTENAEVALLPPVSGGDGVARGEGGTQSSGRAALGPEPLDAESVVRRAAHPSCGAVVVFEGRVRADSRGRRVVGLTYDAYGPLARRRLEAILGEIEEGLPGVRLAVAHRLGWVPAGERTVVIAAAAPHRADAYAASRRALERLKREVPIWKREHYAEGDAAWREEEPLSRPAAGRRDEAARSRR
jgi:molybdopterin synthase catalytic subunit